MCIFRNDVRINIKSIERTGFANFSINKFLFFEFFRKLLSLRLLRFFFCSLSLSRLQFSYHRWKQVILQIISEICLVSFVLCLAARMFSTLKKNTENLKTQKNLKLFEVFKIFSNFVIFRNSEIF